MIIKPHVSHDELLSLAADVARISTLLTREREGLPAAYLKDEGLRKAYGAYFLPSNLAKIHKPLQELYVHPRGLLAKAKLRVLDIGAGPGTASLGMLTFFSQRERMPHLEFTAVDQVSGNLKMAEELFRSAVQSHPIEASLKTVLSGIAGLDHYLSGQYDVIILSNVLNELFSRDEARIEKRAGMLNDILKKSLVDDGCCIVIEPALRETTREMLDVRKGILEEGLHVYSPCLFSGTCPALVNPKDWCHEDIPWDPPPLIKKIDNLTRLRKDALKFSYLVLRKDRFSLADVCGLNSFRVVSEPLVSKGKVEFYICGAGERKIVARLDKDATPGNEPFRDLQRGSVVNFERLIDEGKRFKVGKETAVTPAGAGLRKSNDKA
jgi:ribosomal protein RSM22 (predicted rRNA methylase)